MNDKPIAKPSPAGQSLIANVIYAVGGGSAQRLLSGILHFYLAHVLGPLGYGLVSLAAATISIAGVCVSWGIDITGMRAVARSPDSAADLWISSTRHRLLLTFGALLITVLYAIYFAPSSVARLAIFVGCLQLILLAASPAFVFVGLQRILLMNGLASAGILLQLGLTLALVHGESDSIRAVALAALPPLTMVLGALVYFSWRPRVKTVRTNNTFLSFLREGKHPVAVWFCSTATLNVDLSIIAAVSSPVQAGFYAIGWKLRGMLFGGNALLQTALLPRIAANPNDTDELKRVLLYIEGFVGFVMTGALIACGIDITRLLGPQYTGAYVVISVLGIHTGLLYLFQAAINPLMVENKDAVAMRFYSLETILCIVGVGIGVTVHGILGAACGLVLAEVISLLLIFRLTNAGHGTNSRALWGMGILSVSLGYVFQYIGLPWLPVFIRVVVKGLIFLLTFSAILFLVKREDSKSIFRKLVSPQNQTQTAP
jgi:O-antigen/teichoic acid export membrane protein